MCSESNHLSPNDFFSLLAYGILRILKIYTAYCLMIHHINMDFALKGKVLKIVKEKVISTCGRWSLCNAGSGANVITS